ncbi:A-kinase anchor protein inhibitor 1 [Urocitellus parryii]
MGERYGDSVGNEEGEAIAACATRAPHCEKPGNEPEEVKLQNASKQIVQNAILQAVQQVSQESQPREDRSSYARGRSQLGVQELTKKHEKK